MSDNETQDDTDDMIYDEVCRLIGQCCLMLASKGAETNRARLTYQLKRLHWTIMEQNDFSHTGILLAIELLSPPEDGVKR